MASSPSSSPSWCSNLLLLFFMSLIPFATGFLGEDPARPLAVATYSTVMFLTASTFTWLRYYLVTHLRDEEHAGHLHPRLMRPIVSH
jgi:uncharacterized membrane protein